MPPRTHPVTPAIWLSLAAVSLSACHAAPDGSPVGEAEAQASAPQEAPYVHAEDPVAAGEYLVRVGGCNDCHTLGYNEAGGDVAVEEWLMGMPVGFHGPWGTTYPANLRLLASRVSADQWVQLYSQRELRPPMPWWALHGMSEGDLRAVHAFIRSLGPAGKMAPAYVPPGQEPETPYIIMVPQEPEP